MGDTTDPADATSTSFEVEIETGSEEIALSVSDSDAGTTTSILSITYTTTVPFLDTTYIYMTVPKANKVYDTGNNDGSALSLNQSSTDIEDITTILIDGDEEAITYGYNSKGTDYADDVWCFGLENLDNIIFDSGVIIVIQIEITNPPLVGVITADWTFKIKTAESWDGDENTVSDFDPSTYYDVEEAIDPPIPCPHLTVPTALKMVWTYHKAPAENS